MYWVGITDAESENVWKTIFGKTPCYIPPVNINSESQDYLTINARSNSVGSITQDEVDGYRKALCQGRQVFDSIGLK